MNGGIVKESKNLFRKCVECVHRRKENDLSLQRRQTKWISKLLSWNHITLNHMTSTVGWNWRHWAKSKVVSNDGNRAIDYTAEDSESMR